MEAEEGGVVVVTAADDVVVMVVDDRGGADSSASVARNDGCGFRSVRADIINIAKYAAPTVASDSAAPVDPVLTTYKPSVILTASLAISVALAETTSSIAPFTSANILPSTIDVVKSLAGPRYSGTLA